MKKASPKDFKEVIDIAEAIEKILLRRKLDKEFHRDEFEKYLNGVFQGKDLINPFERRDAGIDDEKWNELLKGLKKLMGIKEGAKDDAEDYLFDF